MTQEDYVVIHFSKLGWNVPKNVLVDMQTTWIPIFLAIALIAGLMLGTITKDVLALLSSSGALPLWCLIFLAVSWTLFTVGLIFSIYGMILESRLCWIGSKHDREWAIIEQIRREGRVKLDERYKKHYMALGSASS